MPSDPYRQRTAEDGLPDDALTEHERAYEQLNKQDVVKALRRRGRTEYVPPPGTVTPHMLRKYKDFGAI